MSETSETATLTGEQQTQAAKQLPLFPVDRVACAEFLDRYLTIEDELDRLREETQGLVEFYKEQLPLRAVRTAIKVIRARKKLAEHHKEPMSYTHQALLEDFVERHIRALDAAKQAAAAEAERAAQRPVPDMTQTSGAPR